MALRSLWTRIAPLSLRYALHIPRATAVSSTRVHNEIINKVHCSKLPRVQDIPKLDDAILAGGPRSRECTLILTEGDSAKALALSGLGIVGRDLYGVFPLKGKVMNVRGRTADQISKNMELANVRAILGLDVKRTYADEKDMDTLRYGKVMLMADQDVDGSHIKGLFLNFVQFFWPKLLQRGGFVWEFITPIVKASVGKKQYSFFTLPEFEEWRQSLSPAERHRSTVKYYKGLGTSTSAEAKKYFSDLPKHRLSFEWSGQPCGEALDLAFARDVGVAAAERKKWLEAFEEGTFLDHSDTSVVVRDFVNRELIHYSRANGVRAIPSVVDGLKPGQRKVLHACFQRKLTKEIKVAQLAGHVAEKTAYHHGEVSLHGTIHRMAQDYVGSNNIPLLEPRGQFGTRHMGGKDDSSARYTFTQLDPLARLVFPEEDDVVLDLLEDDGVLVEPQYYVPIIPMVLVNGASGVGSGWACNILPHNPLDIIDALGDILDNRPVRDVIPWIAGWKGQVIPTFSGRGKQHLLSSVEFRGVCKVHTSWPPTSGPLAEKKMTMKEKRKKEGGAPFGSGGGPVISITDLTAGDSSGPPRWTVPYLEKVVGKLRERGPDGLPPVVTAVRNRSTDAELLLLLELHPDRAEEVLEDPHQYLRLVNKAGFSNMHCFDPKGRIRRYDSVADILQDFVPVRLERYERRLTYQRQQMQHQLALLSLRSLFVQAVVSGEIKVLGEPRKQVEDAIREKLQLTPQKEMEQGLRVGQLLEMPLGAFTKERVADVLERVQNRKDALDALNAMTTDECWRRDLSVLREGIVKRFTARKWI